MPADHLTPRAILLLLWLVAANDWLNRHAGAGWDAPALTLALGAAGTGFGLLEAATGQKLQEKWIGKAVQKVIQFPVLAALYGALALAAGFWSSVTLLNDPSGATLEAELTPAYTAGAPPVSEDNARNPKEPVRFLRVRTSPLGRPYRLLVKGYLAQTLELYPLTGVTVDARRDLRVAPAVLFRPPIAALPPMAAGVQVEIYSVNGSSRVLLARDRVKEQSFLVGAAQPVPPGLLESWRLEAMAQGVNNDQVLAQLLEFWKRPKVLAPGQPLEPGRVIEAVVYNTEGKPLARSQSLLTDDRFQDVPMQLVVSTPQ